MTGYLIRRLGTAIIVVLGVTLMTFAMLHIIAPSPGLMQLGPKAPPAAIKAFNHQAGYDKPIWEQFLTYLGNLLHGNFGWSYKLNQSVDAIFSERGPLSIFLSGTSLVLSIVIALPLGIYQAVKRNSVGDITATALTFIFYSMPLFLFALVLVDLFALDLKWVSPTISGNQSLTQALEVPKNLILPLVTLSVTNIASFSRFQRSSALDVLAQDYIKVARAKGLSERMIYSRHLIRNASLPMVTLIGLSIPALVAGNLLIESVFNIDGLGLTFINSLTGDDYDVLVGYTLITAVLTVVGNLVADIALSLTDPRIRLV
ncbi:ABC transporter permease [Streptacidiphilus sp. P02-A3a]|uniref:ABC transporter permease n=1 Tax=Streptacidiphilus sp. P02-A3a TaxID=2704468 RepID=UPI0015FC1E07|nr:ABC transporter permease [Streptacidiphilus sp. P02-A3a]QMU67706.1 ABC transporter permease [Streptacidiphilus sp. P02-A3a]